jgi:NADH-quinone oxidoreductase subunit N
MNAIVISALMGVVLMLSGLLLKKSSQIQLVAVLGALAQLGATLYDNFLVGQGNLSYFGMLELNSYATWFNVLISACVLIYILLFKKSISDVGKNDSEYYALLFFIMSGVFILASYSNLLMLFVGIEILSIPQYILAGSDKENIKSNEASLKYFLMGSFSTGILLMGITLIYGASGTFNILDPKFMAQFQELNAMSSLSLIGILLLIVSFGFKVSSAPFHFWTPDVYDGTPTALHAFLWPPLLRLVFFIAFIRLFHLSFGSVADAWQVAMALMIALTLLIGNITAIYQQSVKRMMAYSSIAQAGFMLFAVFATNSTSWQGIILYSVSYTLASFGLFAVMAKLKDFSYDGFNGLARKEPILALTAAICVMSLAGIPLTGGFFAKYFVLSAAIEQGKMIWLVIFAVLMAAVSAYYYFRVIMSMYFKSGEPELAVEIKMEDKILLVVNAIVILLIGVLPGLLLI